MDELNGVELRLERAQEQLDALRHELRMYLMTIPQPYNIVVDEQMVAGEYIGRAKVFQQPSPRLGVLLGDALHNMRAALDMIAWELALIGGNPPPDDDILVSFPICTHPDAWESRSTRNKIERISPEAIEVIKSFQPYNDPNGDQSPLAVLQALDNWQKHKTLLVVGSLHISHFVMLSQHRVTSRRVGAFYDGDEICRFVTIPGGDPKERFRARFMSHVGLTKEWPGLGLPIDAFQGMHGYLINTVFPAFKVFFPD